jgi:hypothetical protein
MGLKRGKDEKGPYFIGAHGQLFHYQAGNKIARKQAKTKASNSVIKALDEMVEPNKKKNILSKAYDSFYDDYSKMYDQSILPESKRSRRLWKKQKESGKVREEETKKLIKVKTEIKAQAKQTKKAMKEEQKGIEIKQDGKTEDHGHRKKIETYDWKTDRVETQTVPATYERDQAVKELKQEKQKRRRRWLGATVGAAEPIAKKSAETVMKGLGAGKQSYKTLSLQKTRGKVSPLNKIRQKTTIRLRKKVTGYGKKQAGRGYKKVKEKYVDLPEPEKYDWKTDRMEEPKSSKKKIRETVSYKQGKRLSKKRYKKAKAFVGKTGKAVLGEKTYSKYKNKAIARKERLKKQAKYATKHPYKTMGIAVPKKALKVQKKALGKVAKGNKIASKKMAAAAKLLVKKDGLLAVFKPLYWSLMINAKIMAYPQPILITSVIFGSVLMIWYFGMMSGYYGLFALKALVGTIINVFLTLGNSIVYAINGIYTILLTGIVTIINQIFFYFSQGIIEAINTIADAVPLLNPIDLEFKGLETTYSLDPPFAFSYLCPEPINATDIGSGVGSFFMGWAFIKPGAQFYEYNEATDSYVLEIAYEGDEGERLYLPKINELAISDFISDMTNDKPPPDYDFLSNNAGYVEQYNAETDEFEWVLVNQRSLSRTVFEDIIRYLTGEPENMESWLKDGAMYYTKYRNDALFFGSGEIEHQAQLVGINEHERHYYFFVASMLEWDESLVDVQQFDQQNPMQWKRAGTIQGTDGKEHEFKEIANDATTYVADELEKRFDVETINTKASGNLESLCIDDIYPLYVKYIKEHVAPWYPLK